MVDGKFPQRLPGRSACEPRARNGNGRSSRQVGVTLNGERAAEKVTLHLVTAALAKQCVLRGGFNTLGQNRDVQAMAEIDDGVHDRHRVTVIGKIADESSIDLDLVECKGMQIRQGRVALEPKSSSAIRTPSVFSRN